MTDVPKTCYKDIHFKTCVRNIYSEIGHRFWTAYLTSRIFERLGVGKETRIIPKIPKTLEIRERVVDLYTPCATYTSLTSHIPPLTKASKTSCHLASTNRQLLSNRKILKSILELSLPAPAHPSLWATSHVGPKWALLKALNSWDSWGSGSQKISDLCRCSNARSWVENFAWFCTLDPSVVELLVPFACYWATSRSEFSIEICFPVLSYCTYCVSGRSLVQECSSVGCATAFCAKDAANAMWTTTVPRRMRFDGRHLRDLFLVFMWR